MATQESTLCGDGLNVYFVVPGKYESERECSDDMWLAFNVSFLFTFINFSPEFEKEI